MPKVKAAVLERSRRSTAGKRMQSLMGKAQEDDDAFWSHSIWSEGGGGFSSGRKIRRGDDDDSSSSSDSGSDSDSISDGEGSFRMSDEESEAAVDQFDSDFDESESEDEEEGGEGATERELIAEERRRNVVQRKKRQQMAFQGKGSSGGRELMKKKKGQMTKRGPTGEGWNAGLVLNWPDPAPSVGLDQAVSAKPSSTAQLSAPISAPVEVSSVISSLPAQQSPSKPQHAEVTKPTTSAPKTAQQTSPMATKTKSKTAVKSTAVPRHHLRGGISKSEPKPAAPAKLTQQQRPAVIHKKNTTQKPRISQEELIIEAIKSTEMENAKWLSTRKRVKEEAAHRENAATSKTTTLNPVSRFHSRRGCNNTLTFMDMDHLPDILTRSQPRKSSIADTSTTTRSPRKRRAESTSSHGISSSPDIEKEQTKCIITGKVARYRDPKTMLGYYDLDAFKELRRRLDAGELPKKEKKKVLTKQLAKRKATSGDGAATIAKLSSTGTDVKVKIKVGDAFVPPPKPFEKKEEKAEDSTPNKPRWDDASDNLYAKPFSSSKRRRSPSLSQNDDSSQQEVGQSKSSSDATGEIDSSIQNGNQVNSNDAPIAQPTASSNLSLPPIPSTATAAVPGQPVNGATVKPESGGPPAATSPKKSNVDLKPTSAELNTFMQSWISRPENKNSLMPSLQQKQQIMEETGVDKKRLEGWFYRTRKKMKQEKSPDKTSSLDTKTDLPQVAGGSVVAEEPSNPEVKAEPQLETTAEIQVDKPAEKEVESSKNDQNGNFETKSTPTSQSCETGNEAHPNRKPTTADKDDKTEAQIPLLGSNVNKKCEQTPSKQIQNIILEQSEIQTT